ncbi:hypothetical protein MLD38_025958 [Melastoma candidum]|nr:hypothetical protein MLD38_025958 [Melastoma candidum]
MDRPNEVSWNVIVRRYLEAGNAREAIFVFFEMIRKGKCPLNFTVSNVLIACSRVLAAKEGMQIHSYAAKVCLDSDEVVCSSLICLYLKCDELEDAQMVFDQPSAKSVVSWTSMVSGYALTGRIEKARELFDEMPERNIISWNAMLAGYIGCKKWDDVLNFLHRMLSVIEHVDHVTLSLVAKIAAGLGDIVMGKQLHGFVYRLGYSSNLFVANSLLDMYGKCRNFKISRVLFEQMNQSRDSVSWNSFLASYARHGMSEHAMAIFGEMHWETMLSEFTCGTLLAACANTSSLSYGKQIHAFMLRNEYDIDVVVRGAFVDMYSKCRCIDYGLKVFKEAALRDIVLWNSIILGCCYNGKAREALKLYKLMVKDGAKPDKVTMQGLLLACVLEGRVDLGRSLFKSMSKVYSVIPRVEHYELMVRLYSCHGRIDELETFIKTMPFDPTAEMLKMILKACRKRGLLRMEKWASNLLTGLRMKL